jgi:hypothetical protein
MQHFVAQLKNNISLAPASNTFCRGTAGLGTLARATQATKKKPQNDLSNHGFDDLLRLYRIVYG